MKLFIKNMVSLRCKIKVQEELEKLGIHCLKVELGNIEIFEDITVRQLKQFKENLALVGLELIEDKKSILIERIKNTITEMIHDQDVLTNLNYSHYISQKLAYDYTYLSNIFSEEKHLTIQQFIINHKVEKVKELMQYDEMNITEISYKLNYSSVAHLSNQFKKVTGLSPSYFKQLTQKREMCLESI